LVIESLVINWSFQTIPEKMKIITLISLFLTLLPGSSCNETITKQSAKSKLQALLTIPISDSFKITDYEVEGGIGGDLTEAFIAHFTHEEFNNIFKKVNPEKIKLLTSIYTGIRLNKAIQ